MMSIFLCLLSSLLAVTEGALLILMIPVLENLSTTQTLSNNRQINDNLVKSVPPMWFLISLSQHNVLSQTAHVFIVYTGE